MVPRLTVWLRALLIAAAAMVTIGASEQNLASNLSLRESRADEPHAVTPDPQKAAFQKKHDVGEGSSKDEDKGAFQKAAAAFAELVRESGIVDKDKGAFQKAAAAFAELVGKSTRWADTQRLRLIHLQRIRRLRLTHRQRIRRRRQSRSRKNDLRAWRPKKKLPQPSDKQSFLQDFKPDFLGIYEESTSYPEMQIVAFNGPEPECESPPTCCRVYSQKNSKVFYSARRASRHFAANTVSAKTQRLLVAVKAVLKRPAELKCFSDCTRGPKCPHEQNKRRRTAMYCGLSKQKRGNQNWHNYVESAATIAELYPTSNGFGCTTQCVSKCATLGFAYAARRVMFDSRSSKEDYLCVCGNHAADRSVLQYKKKGNLGLNHGFNQTKLVQLMKTCGIPAQRHGMFPKGNALEDPSGAYLFGSNHATNPRRRVAGPHQGIVQDQWIAHDYLLNQLPGIEHQLVKDCEEFWKMMNKEVIKAVWRTPLNFSSPHTARQCDNSALPLRCDPGQQLIIKAARYGRPSPEDFRFGCGGKVESAEKLCPANAALDVTSIVKKKCQGKAYCVQTVCSKTFGLALCPNIQKYLEVSYECATTKKATASEDLHNNVQNTDNAYINQTAFALPTYATVRDLNIGNAGKACCKSPSPQQCMKTKRIRLYDDRGNVIRRDKSGNRIWEKTKKIKKKIKKKAKKNNELQEEQDANKKKNCKWLELNKQPYARAGYADSCCVSVDLLQSLCKEDKHYRGKRTHRALWRGEGWCSGINRNEPDQYWQARNHCFHHKGTFGWGVTREYTHNRLPPPPPALSTELGQSQGTERHGVRRQQRLPSSIYDPIPELFSVPSRPAQRACAQKVCMHVSWNDNKIVATCENKYARPVAVHGIAHHEDRLERVADGRVSTAVRTPAGSSIEFRYSQLMDYNRIHMFWAPLGSNAAVEANAAYLFSVQCKHESKWVDVFKYPYQEPCAKWVKEGLATRCLKYHSLKHKVFESLRPGWHSFSFSQGTNSDLSSPLQDWQTRKPKCPASSAQWRVHNLQPHPDVASTVTAGLVTFEILLGGAVAPKNIPLQLPPLGGPCGIQLNRDGSKDNINWAKCPKVNVQKFVACKNTHAYHEIPSTENCDMVADQDPGTFTALRHHGRIQFHRTPPTEIRQVWIFRHRLHSEESQLQSFVFVCDRSWRQKFEFDRDGKSSGIGTQKGWFSFTLKKVCQATIMVLDKLESMSTRNKRSALSETSSIVVSEVSLSDAATKVTDLPPQLNEKIQKLWCTKYQTVSIGKTKSFGRKWVGGYDYHMRRKKTIPWRKIASFKPDLGGIPCGSRFVLRVLVNFKGGIERWHPSGLYLQLWDDSNKLWEADLRVKSTHFAFLPTRYEGTRTQVSAPIGGKVSLIGYGSMYSPYAQLSEMYIGETIKLDWWYKTPDPETPCAV